MNGARDVGAPPGRNGCVAEDHGSSCVDIDHRQKGTRAMDRKTNLHYVLTFGLEWLAYLG